MGGTRVPISAADRWDTEGLILGAFRLVSGPGADTTARLLSRTLASSSAGNYVNRWEQFVCVGSQTKVRSFPAFPESVCNYLSTLFEAIPSLASPSVPTLQLFGHNRNALVSLLRLLSHSPTTESIVNSFFVGYLRTWHTYTGLPAKHICLPI